MGERKREHLDECMCLDDVWASVWRSVREVLMCGCVCV